MQARLLVQAIEGRVISWIEHSNGEHVALTTKRITMEFLCQLGVDELLYLLWKFPGQKEKIGNAKFACQARQVFTRGFLFGRTALLNSARAFRNALTARRSPARGP